MKTNSTTSTVLTRRRLLTRVGLAAGAAYMAPAMVGLNAARASGVSGGSSGASRSAASAPSRGNSGPSRGGNSGPSRSGNSGPSRPRRRNVDETPRWLRRLFEGQ
jgi:hypothetical protein